MFKSLKHWIEAENRRVQGGDWDNVMLFTGVEGAGKSTFMRQLMAALDPGFEANRIHFTLEGFLDLAPVTPRFGGVVLDEARLNKRRAMHRGTVQMLDFLQDCRGLNLHIGLCFPHEQLLDSAVKDHRVRWNWHVSKRGTVLLRKRIQKQIRTRKGPIDVFEWKVLQGFTFKDDKGTPLRLEYNAMKEAHMRRVAVDDKHDLEGLGFNVEALEAQVALLKVRQMNGKSGGKP